MPQSSKMNTHLIFDFLQKVAANNNTDWFHAHKAEYLQARKEFEEGVAEVIGAVASFDPSVAHLTPKDCCFRFYRDTRFSQDKSPYKRHFGAYISAHGKKGLHGGYYVHVQPGHCLLAVGSYCLPTNILTAIRNEIMGNIDVWREAVESREFLQTYGRVNEGAWRDDDDISDKGFGIARLKKAPRDFPADYEYLDYLKMKDYCCWTKVPDDFFSQADWTSQAAALFRIAKPMMDFTNSVIDDYE